MLKTFDFCIPTRGTKVPDRADWLHEIKYDGYRLRVERDGDRVRLITRNGYDWTDRYPWVVESALKNRIKQFVIDGEAVVLGVDGIPDFNALHSRKHDEEVQLYAFDILALDGEDLRPLPLSLRKRPKLSPNGLSESRMEAGASRGHGAGFLAPSLPFGFIDAPPSLNRLIGLTWLLHTFYPEQAPGKLREQVRSFYHLFYQVDLTEPDLDTLLGNSGG